MQSIFHVKLYNTGYRDIPSGCIFEGFVFDEKIFAKDRQEAEKKAWVTLEKKYPKKENEMLWHCTIVDCCKMLVNGSI